MAEWVNSWSNKFKKMADSFRSDRPLEEVLPELLDPGDPRVAIRPLGNDWLCPFSAERVFAPEWNGSSLTLLGCPAITKHLLSCPELQKFGPKAEKKNYADLIQVMFNWRISEAANYKLAAADGEWVCPYCLHKSGILMRNWDGSATDAEFFIPQVLKHFAQCADCQADPVNGDKDIEEITAAGGDRTKVANLVAYDPRFRLSDAAGAWLCPYTARPVAHINLRREPWGPDLQEKMVNYILSADCPARYSQYNVERTLEDLKAAASANKRTLM